MAKTLISPYLKRIVERVAPFGFILFFFGLVYVVVERNHLGNQLYYPTSGLPYDFKSNLITVPLVSMLIGWLIGLMEILWLRRLFAIRPFFVKAIAKAVIYLAVLCVLLVVLTFFSKGATLRLPMTHPAVLESVRVYVSTWAFWATIVYIGAIFSITLFVSEVSDYLGSGVLKDLVTGKYHTARQEERIFMFLDMRSSTTIAEKLGHERYHDLLRRYFDDMTDAVLRTSGEIYQYIGDEIVVSWSMENGLYKNNCLRCFFSIKKAFRRLADDYLEEYGLVPTFKAGMHLGMVTTGEIGSIKTDIAFSGDVLNTASRIQCLCNAKGVDLLISKQLLEVLDMDERYRVRAMGTCELRGREEVVDLVTIDKIPKAMRKLKDTQLEFPELA